MNNFTENKNNIIEEKKDILMSFKTTLAEKGEIKKILNTISNGTVSEKILKGLRLLSMQNSELTKKGEIKKMLDVKNSNTKELLVNGIVGGEEFKLLIDGVAMSFWKIKYENFNDYTGVVKLDAFGNSYKIYVENGNAKKVIENDKIMYGPSSNELNIPEKKENFKKISFTEIKNNSTDVANIIDFNEKIMDIKIKLMSHKSGLINEFIDLISNADSFTRQKFYDELNNFQKKI